MAILSSVTQTSNIILTSNMSRVSGDKGKGSADLKFEVDYLAVLKSHPSKSHFEFHLRNDEKWKYFHTEPTIITRSESFCWRFLSFSRNSWSVVIANPTQSLIPLQAKLEAEPRFLESCKLEFNDVKLVTIELFKDLDLYQFFNHFVLWVKQGMCSDWSLCMVIVNKT